MHIYEHVSTHTDTCQIIPQKTKVPSLALEDTLVGQQRRFHEATKATSQKSDYLTLIIGNLIPTLYIRTYPGILSKTGSFTLLNEKYSSCSWSG